MIRRDLASHCIYTALCKCVVFKWLKYEEVHCTQQPYFWCWNPFSHVIHIFYEERNVKTYYYQVWWPDAWSGDLQAYREKYGHAWHWMSFWDQLSLMSIYTIFNLPVTFSGIGHTPHEHSHLPGRLQHTRYARMQATWASQPVLVHPRFTVLQWFAIVIMSVRSIS